MSGFLSPKYLKYHKLAEEYRLKRDIDHDLPCMSCGYNLRGLNYGRNCPECGQHIQPTEPGVMRDPLLAHDAGTRQVISIGLLMGAVTLVAASAARLLVLSGLTFGLGIAHPLRYVMIGLLLSIVWFASCLMMMRAVPRRGAGWSTLTRVVAWSQVLWVPGYVLFTLRVNAVATGAASADVLQTANMLVRGVAGVGAIGVAYFMMKVAQDAELEDTASRLFGVIWVLPGLTVVAALIPTQLPWLAAVFFSIFPLAWCWFMIAWARSLWDMHRHIVWTMRMSTSHARHFQRIDEQKRQLQDEVNSRVRPVSRASDKQVAIDETGINATIQHTDSGCVKRRPSENIGNDDIKFMS